jgi:predicted nucleic acid-binding protein
MSRSVLLDTNLLVLLIVGATSEANIARHKRTKSYDVQSFRLLRGTLLARFTSLVTTPHVLAETSALLRQCAEPLRSDLTETLGRWASESREQHLPAAEVVPRPEYIRIGLTDAALVAHASNDMVLLTDDLEVFLEATRAGIQAENFTHLREAYLYRG